MTDATELARRDGVCKTVYSIYWPFTRDRIDRVWQAEREILHGQYEEAWTKKQDALHDPFLERWTVWATPVRPAITRLVFPYRYPTSGSSEALRETLADFSANRRDNVLHVFAGEYEGCEAYAHGCGGAQAADRYSTLQPSDAILLGHHRFDADSAFNAIAQRPWYDNDAVSDLYYLHEFRHAAGMTYQDGMPSNRWFTKMVANEFEASFCTEVQAYFELAGLRERSFPFDIWADRFLGDKALSDRWATCKGTDAAAAALFWAPLRTRRKEVIVKPPHSSQICAGTTVR